MSVITKDLGAVTAYAAAVNRGYTGTREEFETLMASYAYVGEQAAESAGNASQSATNASQSATDAETAKGTAQQAATDAQTAQALAQGYAQSAQQSAQSASQSAQDAESAKETAVEAVDGFAAGAQQALDSVNQAGVNWKSLAQAKALDSEAYALGTRDGEDVGTSDPAYHNNAKYYAESVSASAQTATEAAQTATQKAGEAAQSASAAAESARTLTIDSTLTQAGQAADSKAVGDKFDASKITEVLTDNYTTGSYIALSVSYGTVVSTSPVTNSAFGYIIVPCKKGDVFTITGTGASAPRLWGFTDSEYKLLSVEGAGITRTDYERTASQDGYFISNVTLAKSYSLSHIHLFNQATYTNMLSYVDGEIADVGARVDGLNTSLVDTGSFVSSIVDIGAVFNINGYINNLGAVSPHNDYKCTDYVQVTSNGSFVPVEYKLRVFTNTKIGLYDANHELISVISPSSSASLEEVVGTLYYVDGLVYARFCTAVTNGYADYYVRMSTVKNQVIGASDNTFCNYNGNEISMFRKGLCIGDSLTQGTLNYYQDGDTGHYTSVAGINYPTYLSKLTGLDVTNAGNAGYTSVDWWNIHQNDDLSGYDFAIIQLGVNDLGHYGSWTEPTETAFINIINKLKTQNKKIKIFVANIIPAISYSSEGYLAMSASISDFVTNLDDEQVILLDMQAHGHTRDSEAYNCGHLSAYGYWRLAQDYKNYIGYYINTHKAQFREVQFIGSDYYYTPVN